VRAVSPDVLAVLVRHPWPGNIRELKNLVESLVVFARGEEISLGDLPAELKEPPRSMAATPEESAPEELPSMAVLEKQAILQALERTGGNRSKASQILGIGLRTLQKKLKDYGMTER
jgi:DNA-binding NtrC family response regulator